MQTTVTENELDLSELDTMLQEAENQVAAIQSQINALESENADLLKKISEASVEDAAVYRQQYNANKTQIDREKRAVRMAEETTGIHRCENRGGGR